jgi:hypothetical protein
MLVCRNIKTLFNFEPPTTEAEIEAAALQYARKVSGFNKPSKVNEAAFETAVAQITAVTRALLNSLKTNAPARDREIETAKAKRRAVQRFAKESL